MQCDEFDARLDNLLDRRSLPADDLRLQRHARVCPRCRDQLTTTVRLLSGLDLLEVPPLRSDFAQRVVQEVVPASQTRRVWWSPSAIAVAATLLLALLPGLGYLLGSSGLWAPIAPTRSGEPGAVAYVTPSTPAHDTPAVEDSPWMRYGNSILELYPEEARARHRQQVSALARDLRPIATPFNAAVTAIRRTIPVSRSTDKGHPSASAAPHDASVPTHA